MMMKTITQPRPKIPSVDDRIQPRRLPTSSDEPPLGGEELDEPDDRVVLGEERLDEPDEEERELDDDPDRDPPLNELPPPGR
jgi:hypothetical protein